MEKVNRDAAIVRAGAAGDKAEDIAARYKLSPRRVRRIIQFAKRDAAQAAPATPEPEVETELEPQGEFDPNLHEPAFAAPAKKTVAGRNDKIREMAAAGESTKQIAEAFGLSTRQVSRIVAA